MFSSGNKGQYICYNNMLLEMISEMSIAYPKEIVEQTSIATVLTNIDILITLHQRKCEMLKNIKKSLLEKMFV